MRLTNDADYWQRHYVIAQTLTAFFELELKYPLVAAVAKSGIIITISDEQDFSEQNDHSENQSHVFNKESSNQDAETENQARQDFLKTICGLASQVFYASINLSSSDGRESESQRALREHGEATISWMVASYWKSLGRYGNHWIYDERLQDLILKVVRHQKDLNRLTSRQSGNPNA